MTTEERLYGLPHAEELFLDVDTFYESVIDGQIDLPVTEPQTWTVEEYSVHPPTYHLPTAEQIVEWATEWALENGEIDESCGDAFINAGKSPAVLVMADALRDVIGTQVRYKMANEKLADHTLVVHPDGRVLFDGILLRQVPGV